MFIIIFVLTLSGCLNSARVECNKINNELGLVYNSRVTNNNHMSNITNKYYEKRISFREHSFYFSKWFIVDEDLYKKSIYLTDRHLEIGCNYI